MTSTNPTTRRIKLTISYVGSAYSGWQRQPNADTIQKRIESAIKLLTNENVSVQGSGRTDAGVHAIKQVAHFDTKSNLAVKNFVSGINHFLPADISITHAEEVDNDFHARYSATEKTYCYVLYESNVDIAIYNGRAVRVKEKLSVPKMQSASKAFLGEHDFTSYMSTNADTVTTTRTIKNIKIERKDGQIRIYATANGFLYNMVRLMVGTLIRAGRGEVDYGGVAMLIEKKDKHAVYEVMPACGLYLVDVRYD